MCKPADNLDNCATCERATSKLDDDKGHCRKCAANDKIKGPFSGFKGRKV